jgi:hypothetical protein
VPLDQLTRARQPQTDAREAPDYVRATMEAVEHVRQVALRDTHTFVTHDEHGDLSVVIDAFLERDADWAAARAVLDCVREPIGQDAMHACLVDGGLEDRHLGLEHEPVHRGNRLVFASCLARQRDQIRAGEQQRRSAGFLQ